MTGERGYQATNLPSWGTLADESNETNPELLWPLSLEVFDNMRREDAQVGSVLRAVQLPIRSTSWVIDPAGASPEVVDFVAGDLGLPVKGRQETAPTRTGGRFSWSEHLRMALLEHVFGHSFFEQVYDVKREPGKAHLAKLAWRPPRTISNIEVAIDGGLVAIVQSGLLKNDVRIPVDRLVAYVNDREGANWLGQSLLRTAYKNWLLKDRMLRAQALTVERNGLGVPVYEGAPIPTTMTDLEKIREWQESEKAAGLALATGFGAGPRAGASIPNGAKLELKGVTGDLPDTDAPIRYHDEQIARAVLAHFLNLGGDNSKGSYALSDVLGGFFTDSLNTVAQHIADIFNQHVIEDLVDLNWGPEEPAPRLVFEPIGSGQPATSTAIKELILAGAITVDSSLEAYMRDRYGLPVRDEPDDAAIAAALADASDPEPTNLVARVVRAFRNLRRSEVPEEDA